METLLALLSNGITDPALFVVALFALRIAVKISIVMIVRPR